MIRLTSHLCEEPIMSTPGNKVAFVTGASRADSGLA
jgi:hypothetical protein